MNFQILVQSRFLQQVAARISGNAYRLPPKRMLPPIPCPVMEYSESKGGYYLMFVAPTIFLRTDPHPCHYQLEIYLCKDDNGVLACSVYERTSRGYTFSKSHVTTVPP